MIEVFVKMDETESGTSNVPVTRKRQRQSTDHVLEYRADTDAEEVEYEEGNDEIDSEEDSDDSELDGVEDDSSKEDDCSGEESDDEGGNGIGQAGSRASDDGQPAVGCDDDLQAPHDAAVTTDRCVGAGVEDTTVDDPDVHNDSGRKADAAEENKVGNASFIQVSVTSLVGSIEDHQEGEPAVGVEGSCSDTPTESDECLTMNEWLEQPVGSSSGKARKMPQSIPRPRAAGKLSDEDKRAYLDFVKTETCMKLPVPEINDELHMDRTLYHTCRKETGIETESMSAFGPLCPKGVRRKIFKEMAGFETKRYNTRSIAKKKGLEAASAVRTKSVTHRSRGPKLGDIDVPQNKIAELKLPSVELDAQVPSTKLPSGTSKKSKPTVHGLDAELPTCTSHGQISPNNVPRGSSQVQFAGQMLAPNTSNMHADKAKGVIRC